MPTREVLGSSEAGEGESRCGKSELHCDCLEVCKAKVFGTNV
jgi:hypothetical protein